MNQPEVTFSSTAQRYHELTKYRAESLGGGPGLDWSKKPQLFKSYAGAETVDLTPFMPRSPQELNEASLLSDRDAAGFTLSSLARTLYLTNGVTAVAQAPGEFHAYRSAPSAGALYPTEIYVAIRNNDELASGVYNYHVLKNELQRVSPPGFGPEGDELFAHLWAASGQHPAFEEADACFLFSTVFYRSAWRYGPRAYRRCMLDTGHVIGNFCAALPAAGLSTFAVGGFVDAEVGSGLLQLEPAQEMVCSALPCPYAPPVAAGGNPALNPAAVSRHLAVVQADEANLLASVAWESAIIRREGAPLERIAAGAGGRHPARRFPFRPGVEIDVGPKSLAPEITPAILRRRSTRRLSAAAVPVNELATVLEYAYRADLAEKDPAKLPAFHDLSLLETWVVIQNVDGLAAGVYHYATEKRELRLVDEGDFRQETHFLALGQDLAAAAAAVIFHTCDLPAAVEKWGNRAYRLMHLDAGHLGERINLACMVAGLGVSGIGGFLDDEVNELLAIPDEQACVYITCIGQPA